MGAVTWAAPLVSFSSDTCSKRCPPADLFPSGRHEQPGPPLFSRSRDGAALSGAAGYIPDIVPSAPSARAGHPAWQIF